MPLKPKILSNVFALHNTNDIAWYRFKEKGSTSIADESKYTNTSGTQDTILQCYQYCLQANYPTCWKYVVVQHNFNTTPTTNNNNNTINSNSGISTNKPKCTRELWIFDYNPSNLLFQAGASGEKDESQTNTSKSPSFESIITFLGSKLSLVSNGTWSARSHNTPVRVTKMLYFSLHNLIERAMHQNSFLRIGECFVKRTKGDQRKNSIEAGLLGCSFTFFLTGETLCLHVRVERVKLRNLLHSDLASKGKVTVFTSPNSLVGTLVGGRLLDDSTSPASSAVLKEWSTFFQLHPPLKSEDESYSRNDKFLSSTAIVKVAFGNRQGFEMEFPAECVFRSSVEARKDPNLSLQVVYRRSLGLEVPKIKNMNYPDAAGFALLSDYQWSEEDDDPSRHMQVDFWTYTSPFQYHTIQTVYQQRQLLLQQQQQQKLQQKTPLIQDHRSPIPAKVSTPQQATASPIPSSPYATAGEQGSPALTGKDTGSQSETTEEKRPPPKRKSKDQPAASTTSRPPKKPKKDPSPIPNPIVGPPLPAPEKKKPAPKKGKKGAAPATTTTGTGGKGKKAKSGSDSNVSTPQLELNDSSNALPSIPMMAQPASIANPSLPESIVSEVEQHVVKRSTDEDMEELGGNIDLDLWLSATSSSQNAVNEFDSFFGNSPVTTPAINAKGTVPMSPNTFPLVDDAVEIQFGKPPLSAPPSTQPLNTPQSTNPSPSPSPSSPLPSPSPLSSPNIGHTPNPLLNSDSGTLTAPHTPQLANTPAAPPFLSASHDSYLPLANRQNKSDKKPKRMHTFLCAKSYQPLQEGDLPAISSKHSFSYTPISKGPSLVASINYTPEPFPFVPPTTSSTPSTPNSALPTPISNPTPTLAFTSTPTQSKPSLDIKNEDDASESESEESSDDERDIKKETSLAVATKPVTKAEDFAKSAQDSLQYLKEILWNIFREQSPTLAAAATSGSATFSQLLPWDPMPDCTKCDSHLRASDSLHDALVLSARVESLKLSNEKISFLGSNPDLCYVLEQLALSAYDVVPREGSRGVFTRLSASLSIASLSSCQNAKGGFCVWDDHNEMIEENVQQYSVQSPHSPITYAADPASVGRMLFSLTPVFESIFGEKTIKGPLDLPNWLESDSDTICEPQESSPLLVGHKDSWVSAPPENCMRLWDKAQMEPYSSRKNVTYYVLCPQSPTMSSAAASFFSDLSCVYEASHLGRHSAQTHYPEYPQGLIFVSAIPTPPSQALTSTPSESEEPNPAFATSANRWAAFREHKEAYREACWRLGSHLRSWEQQYNENMNTVVYVIDPFTTTTVESGQGQGKALFDDLGQFILHALADILAAQSKSSRRSTVLQIVPASELFLPTSDQAVSLRELAFSVFTKLRRLSFTLPSPSIPLRNPNQTPANSLASPPLLSPPTSTSGTSRQEQQLYEPAFVLANPPPIFSTGENVLHCCYSNSDDLSCTSCCITDSKGELLETKLFPATSTHNTDPTHILHNDLQNNTHPNDHGNHSTHNNGTSDNNNNTQLFEMILKFCITCIEWTSRNDWTIVISKMGILSFKELEEWELLLNDVKSTLLKTTDNGTFITNIVLASAHFNPRLQLLSINSPDQSPSNDFALGNSVEALASTGSTSYLVFPPRPTSHYSNHSASGEWLTPLASSYIVTEKASEKTVTGTSSQYPKNNDLETRGDKWPKIYMVYLFGLYSKTRTISALEQIQSTLPNSNPPNKQRQQDINNLIRGITRQFVALSWLNVTPLFPYRLSVLPHHFAIALRLARLVAILDSKEEKEEKEVATPPLVQSIPSTPIPTSPAPTTAPLHIPAVPVPYMFQMGINPDSLSSPMCL